MSAEPLNDSYADRVKAGDVIEWCGRAVHVVNTEHSSAAYGHRPFVYLTVESDDVPRRRLHYWAHELVTRHA